MNGTKIRDISSSDILLKHFLKIFFKQIAVAAAGFFASSASFDGLSPFGVSLAAGILPEYIPAAVLGAAAGSFYIYGVTVLTLRYIAAAAIAGILSYILKRNLKRKYHIYFSTLSGFFSLFATGLVLSLSVTVSVDEFILYGAEGAVGATGAWFIDKFLNINPVKRYISRFSGAETASVLVVFGVTLLSLCSFEFYVFSPAVIAGVYAVLVSSVYGGDKYGAIFGITAGAVLGLIEKSGFLTGGMALGGLLCGFFSRQNRFFASVIFIISVSVTAFASDDWISAVNIIYCVGIAVLAFIATPKKITKIYKKVFAVPSDGTFLSGQRGVLKSRLKIAAEGMNDVTSSVKAVAGIYRRRTTPREESIYDNVCNRICRNCDCFNACCNRNYNETISWFAGIANALKRSGEPTEKELPKRFQTSCVQPNKIIQELSYEVECYRSALRESAKTGETVNIVSDQFGSVAQLLESFSETMEQGDEYDIARTGIVCDVLANDMGLNVISCGVFKNYDRKLFCEITLPDNKKTEYEKIVSAVAEVLNIRFEKPVTRQLADGSVNLSFCERTKYIVESGNCQISSGGDKWCGDTFDSFYDGKGNFYMVLSDGMGTGKKAAADSVMCCSLASVLLRAGYPVDSILKMINSAMLVRSGEESLATLDIAVMNLYTGDVEFYKAGAASSIAMKKLKLLRIEKPSLPVGILGNVKFETVSLSLRDSDVFVLMSDGVSDESASVWREILKDATEYDGKELAEKLAKSAFMNSGKENADDITVVTAAISLNDKQ